MVLDSEGGRSGGGRQVFARLTTETKHAFKTTEFWTMVAIVAGILIASMVVGDGDSGGDGGENANDGFPAVRAWLYVAIVGSAYMVSRREGREPRAVLGRPGRPPRQQQQGRPRQLGGRGARGRLGRPLSAFGISEGFLVQREIDEGDDEDAGEQQQEQPEEGEAENHVLVGDLCVGIDRIVSGRRLHRVADGLGHRSTGSTATAMKSSARYASE